MTVRTMDIPPHIKNRVMIRTKVLRQINQTTNSKVTTKNRPRTILLNTPACRRVVKIPCLLQVSTAPSTNVPKAVANMATTVLRLIVQYINATIMVAKMPLLEVVIIVASTSVQRVVATVRNQYLHLIARHTVVQIQDAII